MYAHIMYIMVNHAQLTKQSHNQWYVQTHATKLMQFVTGFLGTPHHMDPIMIHN